MTLGLGFVVAFWLLLLGFNKLLKLHVHGGTGESLGLIGLMLRVRKAAVKTEASPRMWCCLDLRVVYPNLKRQHEVLRNLMTERFSQ